MPKQKTISKDIPLAEITLRRYEKPANLSDRELIRKICLSIGLLQPGDSRDIIVDVFHVLIRSKKHQENQQKEIESIEIEIKNLKNKNEDNKNNNSDELIQNLHKKSDEIHKKMRGLTSDEICSLVIEERKKLKLPMLGIASSNIRRQVKRLKDSLLVEKRINAYRITEHSSLHELFEEKIEKFLLPSINSRIKEYLKKLEELP